MLILILTVQYSESVLPCIETSTCSRLDPTVHNSLPCIVNKCTKWLHTVHGFLTITVTITSRNRNGWPFFIKKCHNRTEPTYLNLYMCCDWGGTEQRK